MKRRHHMDVVLGLTDLGRINVGARACTDYTDPFCFFKQRLQRPTNMSGERYLLLLFYSPFHWQKLEKYFKVNVKTSWIRNSSDHEHIRAIIRFYICKEHELNSQWRQVKPFKLKTSTCGSIFYGERLQHVV